MEYFNGCSRFGGVAVVSCFIRKKFLFSHVHIQYIIAHPQCYGNGISLRSASNYTFQSGLSGSSGRLVSCYDGQFVDICNETDVNFDPHVTINNFCLLQGYSCKILSKNFKL